MLDFHKIKKKNDVDYSNVAATVSTCVYTGPPVMGKHGVINKTRVQKLVSVPPQDDRAAAIGNMHRQYIGEVLAADSRDVRADRQTNIRQTDTLITILRSRTCME